MLGGAMVEPPEVAMTDVITRPDSEEIDEELLIEAQRQLEVSSPNAAINEALRRVVEAERARRRQALERTQQMADDGLLDFSKLDDLDR
jgi:Arc/MetJ family transcription regulator